MAKVDPTKSVKPLAKRAINLTGNRFGKLVVQEFAGRNSNNITLWKCQCDCGRSNVIAQGSQLRGGFKRSCGCLIADINRANKTKHGMKGTPEYQSWRAMLSRCLNKNATGYSRYGGSGITVCERWQESFEHFYEDMGPRPTISHTLDRYPDNTGNYEPGNCRWATKSQQAKNCRWSTELTHDGKTLTIREWAEHLSISISTIRGRIRAGRPVAEILQTSRVPHHRKTTTTTQTH